jgi:hypothetical protein
MKVSWFKLIPTAGLLVPSVWVFIRGAGDEPYVTFHARDAVVQIGVASALMALWVVWAGFVSAQVAKRKLHPAWLVTVALCIAAVCGLYQCPAGYISDLAKFGVVVR